MITFVTGKPGDGKSMYGMKLIVDSLLNSDRIIATNIAVKLPELRAYLILKGWKPAPGEDINERVILLQNEDVFEFYRHRSGGYLLPPSPDWVTARQGEDEDGNKVKKLSRYQFLRHMTAQMREMKKHKRAHRSVEYHIDEAHDYFSAREWTDTGRGILWYASKHRHLHDEIVLYTQVMKNVEGQLRGLASFTVRARNQIRMRWGPFRKAPIFRLYHYYGGPEDTDKVQAFNTGVMQLDVKGLCQTYNSTGALSVHDKPEVVTNKAPLPYWALPVACGVLILIVVSFMALLPLLAGKYAGARIKGATAATSAALGVPIPAAAPVVAPVVVAPVVAPVSAIQPGQTVDTPKEGRAPRSAFARPGRTTEAESELPTAEVAGTMVEGTTLFVFVKGYNWATVRADLGAGLLELGNGVVVRKADVLNPWAKKKSVEPQRVSDYLGGGRLAANRKE